MKPRTQDDIVRQDIGYVEKEYTRVIKVPGIESLHTRPLAEIAEVLANVLRMEKNIHKISWEIGEAIELTCSKS